MTRNATNADILRHIAANDGDISALRFDNRQNSTWAIRMAALERKGLVARRKVRLDDRSVYRYSLTPAGREAIAAA